MVQNIGRVIPSIDQIREHLSTIFFCALFGIALIGFGVYSIMTGNLITGTFTLLWGSFLIILALGLVFQRTRIYRPLAILAIVPAALIILFFVIFYVWLAISGVNHMINGDWLIGVLELWLVIVSIMLILFYKRKN